MSGRKLTTEQVIKKFGNPGDATNLTSIDLPFPFYLDWDTTKSVSKIICHKGIAQPIKDALTDILASYGQTKIKESGIDQFAGCFNHRPQRSYETQYAACIANGDVEGASKYLSRHSWAIAIDLDANRNTLRETKKTARFARPEYKEMISIFYKHGFIMYGVEFDYDWMHIEYYGESI